MGKSDPFASLRARFIERCGKDAARLAALDEVTDDERLEILHRLRGTAGTLGFNSLSILAGRAEDAFLDNALTHEHLSELLAELKALQAL